MYLKFYFRDKLASKEKPEGWDGLLYGLLDSYLKVNQLEGEITTVTKASATVVKPTIVNNWAEWSDYTWQKIAPSQLNMLWRNLAAERKNLAKLSAAVVAAFPTVGTWFKQGKYLIGLEQVAPLVVKLHIREDGGGSVPSLKS